MEQNKRVSKRIIISLLLSAAIVIMEIIGLVISIRMHGIKLFQYYTQDSNLFAMISFAIGFYFSLWNLLVKKSEPRWSVFLRYISANCLALTFLVVIFVLAPTMGGYRALLTKDSMLYHHLLCPVAVFVHFVFFDHIEIADKKTVLFAQIPTFVYAVIILSMNIMRLIRGPYPFPVSYTHLSGGSHQGERLDVKASYGNGRNLPALRALSPAIIIYFNKRSIALFSSSIASLSPVFTASTRQWSI